MIRWISFGFCVFNHTPISFIKSSHQHFIFRILSPSSVCVCRLPTTVVAVTLPTAFVLWLLLVLLLLAFWFSLFRTLFIYLFFCLCNFFACVRVCVYFLYSFALTHCHEQFTLPACHAPCRCCCWDWGGGSIVKLFTK